MLVKKVLSYHTLFPKNWQATDIKEQTRKRDAGCSKHCFEVVDRTDEVSSKYYFEVTDGS